MYDLAEITIRSISVAPMDNNVYLLTSKSSGAQVLIDAANEADSILELIESGKKDSPAAHLVLIGTTHCHHDHVQALGKVHQVTQARTAAGSEDAPELPVPTDVLLEHGDLGEFDGFTLEAVKLRGHTPGSVAFLYRDPHGPAHLFSGDSLFPGGLGNTQQDPERFESLYNDVVTRVFDVLDDDTVVHPGHGAETTLGAERPHLQEWKERGW